MSLTFEHMTFHKSTSVCVVIEFGFHLYVKVVKMIFDNSIILGGYVVHLPPNFLAVDTLYPHFNGYHKKMTVNNITTVIFVFHECHKIIMRCHSPSN